jgi:hypothetical protein
MKPMKKITLIVALLFSVSLFAQTQKHEPTIRKERLNTLLEKRQKPERINMRKDVDQSSKDLRHNCIVARKEAQKDEMQFAKNTKSNNTPKQTSSKGGKQRLDSLVAPGMQKEAYRYDNNGNLITEDIYMWMGGSWMAYGQYTYTYDNNENLTREATYIFGTLYAEILYTYDNNGNLIGRIEDDIEFGKNKIEYEYNNGNLTTEVHYEWENNDWIMSEKLEYTYANGSLTERIRSYWNGTWELAFKFEYEYGTGTITIKTYRWEDDWVLFLKEDFVNDNFGNQMFYGYYVWANDVWVPMRKAEFTRKSNGFPLTSTVYDWISASNTWVENYKFEFVYDNNENLESQGLYNWVNDNWVAGVKYEYTYDLAYSNSDIIAPPLIKDGIFWRFSNNKIVEVKSPFFTFNYYYSTVTNEDDLIAALLDSINALNEKITNLENDTLRLYNLLIECQEGGTSNANLIPQEHIQIYPNPVNYELRIVNYEFSQGDIVELFDINGRRVYFQRVNSQIDTFTIDMSNFQSGNYILRIGNRVAKVVKN